MNNDFEKNNENLENNPADAAQENYTGSIDTTGEHIVIEEQTSQTLQTPKEPEEFADSPYQSEIVYEKENEKTDNEGFGYSIVDLGEEKEEKKTGASLPKYEKPSHDGRGLKIFALIIAAVFTLSFTCLSSFIVLDSLGIIGQKKLVFDSSYTQDDSSAQNLVNIPDPAIDSTGTLSVKQIADKCTSSSVGILVEFEKQSYFGTYKSAGVGSGFILSEDGYIATNSHVVSGASRIVVVLNDVDSTEYEATLVGTDAITDVAVIKIEATGLPVAELGNSDTVKVGDLAVAIGTPASIKLAGTVTDGIISAVGRKIDITDSYGRVQKTMTLIQTNATINPGNSGGPLINDKGQVIGINTLKLTDEFEGIGFAIPINGAVNIINQLINDGVVSDRAESFVTGSVSIGIQGTPISKSEAEYYGIPQGVLVLQLDKNNSSAKAGLRRGDIITKFDGVEVKTVEEIIELKSKYKVGDEVTLTVYRDGELDITFNLDMQKD